MLFLFVRSRCAISAMSLRIAWSSSSRRGVGAVFALLWPSSSDEVSLHESRGGRSKTWYSLCSST